MPTATELHTCDIIHAMLASHTDATAFDEATKAPTSPQKAPRTQQTQYQITPDARLYDKVGADIVGSRWRTITLSVVNSVVSPASTGSTKLNIGLHTLF